MEEEREGGREGRREGKRDGGKEGGRKGRGKKGMVRSSMYGASINTKNRGHSM